MSAYLIYGIPISMYDDDGEPTVFCQRTPDEGGDWVDLTKKMMALDGIADPHDEVPTEIWHGYDQDALNAWKAVHPDWEDRSSAWWATFREYEKHRMNISIEAMQDSNEGTAILTATRVKSISAWLGDPEPVSADALNVNDKANSKANEDINALKLGDLSFYGDAGWYLVATEDH